MGFYDFIQIFSKDDTPLGDLANWISQDVNFPKDDQSTEEIWLYCRNLPNVDNSILESLRRALHLYSSR